MEIEAFSKKSLSVGHWYDILTKMEVVSLNYWMVPRNKRSLISVPLFLAAFNTVLNQPWTIELARQFEERLEALGLKRPGNRREGSGSGARTYRAQLYCLGLIFYQKTGSEENYRLTRAGERLFNGESPVDIITNQLIKLQFPSSYSIGRGTRVDRRFNLHPFRFLLRLLSRPEIEYLTQEELALLVITEADSDSEACLGAVIDRIIAFRQQGRDILPDDFFMRYASRLGEQSLDRTINRLTDAANTVINYLEYTQLAARDEEGLLRIVDSARTQAALQQRTALRLHPERHELFQRNFGLGPGDTRDNRQFGDSNVSQEQIQSSLVRAAFHDMACMEIMNVNDAAVIERVSLRTGLSEPIVRRHLRPYSGRERDIMASSYVAMAFAGRDEATDFEIATMNLLGPNGLGFISRHVGGPGRGIQPDVHIQDGADGLTGIIDSKAYATYSINNDHRNRMLHNYIPFYRNQDGDRLCLFMYVAGGFGNRFVAQLQSMSGSDGIGGLGITAANLLALATIYRDRRDDIRERLMVLSSENRVVEVRDFL